MLRDNQNRARTARLVFLLYSLSSVALAGLSGAALLLSDWSLPDNENASALSGLAMACYYLLLFGRFALYASSYIVLILWLRRAYYNLHQLPGLHPSYSDGWAAGAWFVPFICLVRPYTITREVWTDTQLAARGHTAQAPTILGWWWGAYLLKLTVGQITVRLTGKGGDAVTLGDLPYFICDAVTSFLFAAFTWYIIGRIMAFEEDLAMRQQVALLGQPATQSPLARQADQPNYELEEGY